MQIGKVLIKMILSYSLNYFLLISLCSDNFISLSYDVKQKLNRKKMKEKDNSV